MNTQRGFLSLVAAFIIVIFGLLSAALVQMYTSLATGSVSIQANNKAYGLAVAAVNVGIYELTKFTVAQNNMACIGPFAYQATRRETGGEYRYACRRSTSTTTLSSPLAGSATTVRLTNGASLASLGFVRIDNEVIYYNRQSGNTLSGVRRGQKGTNVAPHSIGATVRQNQYVITAQGAVPSISNPLAVKTIRQAIEFVPLLAGNSTGLFYAYNGSTWVLTGDNVGTTISMIGCLSGNNCQAISIGRFYYFNGSIVTPASLRSPNAGASGGLYPHTGIGVATPVGNSLIQAIFCINPKNCKAGGANGLFYEWEGAAWTRSPSEGAGTITSISNLRIPAVTLITAN